MEGERRFTFNSPTATSMPHQPTPLGGCMVEPAPHGASSRLLGAIRWWDGVLETNRGEKAWAYFALRPLDRVPWLFGAAAGCWRWLWSLFLFCCCCCLSLLVVVLVLFASSSSSCCCCCCCCQISCALPIYVWHTLHPHDVLVWLKTKRVSTRV